VVLFLLGLALLQQGIAFGNLHVRQLEKGAAVIADNDIDPSTLFYMESPLALRAEKIVRQRTSGD
jgi:hypothetical protein